MSSRTGRHTSRHRRQGALHAGADTVQLQQHFNRSIPFYMLLNDTRVFVKQSRAGISGQGLWQSALSPHDVHRSGCQCSTIIIYSSGRRSVFRQTRQPNLSGLLLSTLSSPPRYLVTCRLAILLAFKFEFFSWAYEEKFESRTKVLYAKDRKIRAPLFAHSFETKVGLGFGLASYLKTNRSRLFANCKLLNSCYYIPLYSTILDPCRLPGILIWHSGGLESDGFKC